MVSNVLYLPFHIPCTLACRWPCLTPCPTLLQNGSVSKVKELVDVLNKGEGLTTSVDVTDVVGKVYP